MTKTLLIAFTLFSSMFVTSQTVYYVDSSRPDNSGTGTSWASAKKNIGGALMLAFSGNDTIKIKDGVYSESLDYNLTVNFPVVIIRSDGTLNNEGFNNYDGFSGGVVIDCGNTQNSRAFHVTADLTLRGITIRNGYQFVNTSTDHTIVQGGGILVANGAQLTTENCIIHSCRINNATSDSWFNSRAFGGAISVENGSLTATNCLFYSNKAECQKGKWNSSSEANAHKSYGGAIYVGASSSLTITNCTFAFNEALNHETGSSSIFLNRGGSVFILSTAALGATITNCIFNENKTIGIGAAGLNQQIDLFYTETGATIEYTNITRENKAGNNWLKGTGCLGVSSDFGVDPIFIHPASGNFEIDFSSPCRDAGTTVGAPIKDMKGNDRDAFTDMGCLEKLCISQNLDAKANGQDVLTIPLAQTITLSSNATGGQGCSSPSQWEYAWYTGTGNDNSYYNGSSWNNSESAPGVYSSSWATLSGISPIATTTYKVKSRCTSMGCSSNDATGVTVTVIDNTGIISTADTQFKVYPNPINDGFLILDLSLMQSMIYEVAIYDYTGRIVYYNSVEGGKPITLNLKNLNNGVYRLTLTNLKDFDSQVNILIAQ